MDKTVDNQEIIEVSTDEIVEPEYDNDNEYDVMYDDRAEKAKLLSAGIAGGGIGVGLTILAIRIKKWRERRILEKAEKIEQKQNDSDENITEDKE